MSPLVETSFLLNHLSHAILMVTRNLNILYMNPAAESLFGISHRKAHHFKLDHLPINSKQSFGDYLKRAFETKLSFTYRELDITLIEQARHVIADCTLNYVAQASGEYLIVELTDIGHMLRISREEQRLNQQQANHEIIRGIAHEIKNPLGGIRGAAQLLERELPGDKHTTFTKIIISEVDRLQNLVNRMLGPNKRPRKELLNIHEILEHVIQLLAVESNREILFCKNYDPSIPELTADRDQLIQATLNIVRNAWEAAEHQCNIAIRTRTKRQFTIGQTRHRLVICIEITDNGPGIPEDLIEYIFYPMVTGRSQGTGLGLSIAQSLIGQHNGLIECNSMPGETNFAIYLPLANHTSVKDCTLKDSF